MEHESDRAAAPGRWLRLLRRDEFARLMGAAIEGALTARGVVDPARARLLRWDALRRFAVALAERTRRVRGLTRAEVVRELERTHGALLRRRQEERTELGALERELARARASANESVLTHEEESTLSHALEADLLSLLVTPRPRANLSFVIEREGARRRRALAGAVARERERIDQLERRIAKLRASLETMERALLELARRAELDTGLPSIYRTVQGLELETTGRAEKAAMLARLFEQNLALQKKSA